MHDARHAVLFLKYVAPARAYKGDAVLASLKAHITNLARGQSRHEAWQQMIRLAAYDPSLYTSLIKGDKPAPGEARMITVPGSCRTTLVWTCASRTQSSVASFQSICRRRLVERREFIV
jgi:hypothetical protein